jgi:proliferating cell nuclear antigen
MAKIMHLKTVQSNAIRTLIEVLKDVLNDINIVFDENGMKIVSMDGNHVALIHLQLDHDKFEEYYCKEKITIGLSMISLYKLVKSISNTDTVGFFILDNNQHQLCITIENSDKNQLTQFNLKLLDIDYEELSIPSVEIDCIVTMPSHDFQRMCRDMSNLHDTLQIDTEKKSLKLSCEGDFASQQTIIGEANHGMFFHKTSNELTTGRYSLKYLNLFTKSTNLCNTIEIHIKTDYPLILKYNVANLGEIRFCLAPKAI